MSKKATVILPQTQRMLNQMGEQIRLARLRRRLTAELVAERAGISRMTLSNIEKGSPSVAIGSYAAVLHALNGMDITICGNLCYTPDKGIYLDTPKNGRSRTIDVDPQIIALLRELRLEQSKKAISQYVFTQEGSPEPIHPQSPARYLQNFARKYGVQGLHPHKLRHSFASIAITNGADIASVSEKLGHTDKAVTLRMYTHADQESIRRASQIFRDAIKEA